MTILIGKTLSLSRRQLTSPGGHSKETVQFQEEFSREGRIRRGVVGAVLRAVAALISLRQGLRSRSAKTWNSGHPHAQRMLLLPIGGATNLPIPGNVWLSASSAIAIREMFPCRIEAFIDYVAGSRNARCPMSMRPTCFDRAAKRSLSPDAGGRTEGHSAAVVMAIASLLCSSAGTVQPFAGWPGFTCCEHK